MLDRDDLTRNYIIDVAASGHCWIRKKGAHGERRAGTIPAFSTNTEEEAKMLLVRHCKLGYDGIYVWPEMDENMDCLGRFIDALRLSYAEACVKRRGEK